MAKYQSKFIILLCLICCTFISGCASNVTEVDGSKKVEETLTEITENLAVEKVMDGQGEATYNQASVSTTEMPCQNISTATSFSSFSKVKSELGLDLIDFGIEADVYLTQLDNCRLLQSDIYFQQSERQRESDNEIDSPVIVDTKPISQTVIESQDEDTRREMSLMFYDMSYQSDNYHSNSLSTDVIIYYGEKKEGNSTEQQANAVFEINDAVYILSFPYNADATISDFLNIAKTFIEEFDDASR